MRVLRLLLLAIVVIAPHIIISLVAGWWTGVCTFLTMVIVFLICAWLVRGLYDGRWRTVIASHLFQLAGVNLGFQIVEDGATTFPPNAGRLLGPRFLIIRPDNAVILENGARQTRIAGPTTLTTDRFEYVKRVFDLRRQQRSWVIEDVLTKDLMPLTVRIAATYGPRVRPRARTGELALNETERDFIRQADLNVPDLAQFTHSAMERAVGQVAGQVNLNDFLDAANREQIEQEIFLEANRRLRPWGVRVDTLMVEGMRPQPAVTTATTTQWVANAEIVTEQRRNRVWQDWLAAVASGYQQAMAVGVPRDAIHREAVRRTLEQIGRSLNAGLSPAWETLDAVDRVRRLADLENVPS